MEWQAKSFDELSREEFFDIAYERIRTFVIAQHRPYQEIDATDKVARHILGYQAGHVTFGRVLTIPEQRGTGLGRQLMVQIEAEIRRNFAGEAISIEAQIDKQHFYEKFGYAAIGAVFDFNGTPHIRMDKAGL
ncbi:MAG: GNAT family N-acetyltransferase [Levilactobacillus brevis]